MIDALLLGLALTCLGGHVAAPWRLSGQAAPARRSWQMLALPVLLAGLLAFLGALLRHPDRAVAGGLATFPGGSPFERLLTSLFAAVFLIDLVLLLAGARFKTEATTRWGWRLAAVGAVPLLIGFCLATEVTRIGEGPLGEPMLVWPAVFARALLALAAGDLWVAARPAWSPIAAVAIPIYALVLPEPLQQGLWHLGLPLTAGAAVALLLAARWLPRVYRTIALAAGVLLASVFLAQAAQLSESLSGIFQ